MDRSLLHRSIPLLIGIAVGCSSGGARPGAVSQTVGSAGAAIEITSSGSSTIAGTTLLIPAGALDRDTTITIAPAPAPIAATGETAVGPTVRFEPDGLVFLKPATLTLPFTSAMQPARTNLAIDFRGGAGSGQYSGASLSTAGDQVSVDIGHFTDYQVVAVAGRACQSNLDCASGEACVAGACATSPTDGGVTDGGVTDGAGPIDGGAFDGAPTDGIPLHDASTFDASSDAATQYCTSDSQCATGQHCVANYCQ